MRVKNYHPIGHNFAERAFIAEGMEQLVLNHHKTDWNIERSTAPRTKKADSVFPGLREDRELRRSATAPIAGVMDRFQRNGYEYSHRTLSLAELMISSREIIHQSRACARDNASRALLSSAQLPAPPPVVSVRFLPGQRNLALGREITPERTHPFSPPCLSTKNGRNSLS